MVSRTDIEGAISADPVRAEQALLALQAGSAAPVTLESMKPVAELAGVPLASLMALRLEARGLLDAYGLLLAARGVQLGPVAEPEDEIPGPEDQRIHDFTAFEPLGKAAACRIVRGDEKTGSGCLIGPSLVLTAWHVIASAGPDAPNPISEPISVLLADNTRRSVVQVDHYLSPCTLEEFASGLPLNESAYDDRHDVAVLRLRRADGMRLNFLRMPDQPPQLRPAANVFVLDFPEGRSRDWGMGRVARIPNTQARMKHDSRTDAGSSGAACVNTRYELVGIHQGRWPPARRLVPLARFHSRVLAQVQADVAPQFLWSLAGDLDGQLVIGRDLFFEAVAEAARSGSRVRGVRVKRLDLRAGTEGLAFSATLLKAVLDRDPTRHALLRVGFDQPNRDLLAEIHERVCELGLRLEADTPPSGARPGDTTPEAAASDQARRLAEGLDAAVLATGADRLFWVFFENPAAGLTDGERIAFEAFVGAALRQPRLRLVLAGFETISTPGEEFPDPGSGQGPGAPGLVVEYVGRFSRRDVGVLVKRAARALEIDLGQTGTDLLVKAAVKDLAERNDAFSAADSAVVVGRLAERLADWRDVVDDGP